MSGSADGAHQHHHHQQQQQQQQQHPSIVVTTAQQVVEQAQHVAIDDAAVAAAAQRIVASLPDIHAAQFDKELHFFDGGPLTAQFLLVVDTLNFCFWPDGAFEYEHLAGGIKASLLRDPTCLDAAKLAAMTGAGIRQLVGWHRDLPQQEERARLVREVGCALQESFGGQAAGLIAAAGHSALRLVQLLAQHCPGFRDHAIYRGRQVFLYKRAQIFAADLFGAFGGEGLGAFTDIAQLTMFADYRVPTVLQQLGVLRYSAALAAKVEAGEELPAGGEEEVELRAASIMAVEALKQRANALLRQQQPAAPPLMAVHLDWWLWADGERQRTQLPHHKTWTIYY